MSESKKSCSRRGARVKIVKCDGRAEKVIMSVPEERSLTILLNGEELATLLATPICLKELAVGLLYAEGFVDRPGDVERLVVDEDGSVIRVETKHPARRPSRKIYTSGFGKGVTFDFPNQRGLVSLASDKAFLAQRIVGLMRKFLSSTEIHRSSGGVHCSALCDEEGILSLQEDIGRHNTIDKVLGDALLRAIPTKDKALFTTGRISSEMLVKAIRAEIPVVVSHSTPTDVAVKLGEDYGVAVIGYVRMGKMCIFSHPERVKVKSEKS